jgi:hypothetical protein
MNTLFMLFRVVLVLLPLVLDGIAWRLFLRNPDSRTVWRQRAFRIGIAGIAANYALFWTDFMVIPVILQNDYWHTVIGWMGVTLSFTFLGLACMGSGAARICAALASVGVWLLWVSIGFRWFGASR